MLSARKTIWFTNHSLRLKLDLFSDLWPEPTIQSAVCDVRLLNTAEQALNSRGRGSINKQHLKAGLISKQTESKMSPTSNIIRDACIEECNVLESIRNPTTITSNIAVLVTSSVSNLVRTQTHHFSKSHPMASESKRVIVVTGASRGLGVSRIERSPCISLCLINVN